MFALCHLPPLQFSRDPASLYQPTTQSPSFHQPRHTLHFSILSILLILSKTSTHSTQSTRLYTLNTIYTAIKTSPFYTLYTAKNLLSSFRVFSVFRGSILCVLCALCGYRHDVLLHGQSPLNNLPMATLLGSNATQHPFLPQSLYMPVYAILGNSTTSGHLFHWHSRHLSYQC